MEGDRISAQFTDPEYVESRMTQSVHDGIIQRRRPVGKAELISTHAVISQNPLPATVIGDCKCGCIGNSATVLLVKTLNIHIALISSLYTIRCFMRGTV